MTEQMAELMQLFKSEDCDYERCRQLIREIGGCCKVVKGEYDLETTPLYDAVNYGHYDFAMELIREPGADLNVAPDGDPPLMWELQYLWEEDEKKRCLESKERLRLVRALIEAGADPNPVLDGEELMYYVRFKVAEREGDGIDQWHNTQLEHIVEAHAYGKTALFFEKLRTTPVREIQVSDWSFWLFDEDSCDTDHAVFVFDDGEEFSLSSYQTGDDTWDFYAVPVAKNVRIDPAKYHIIRSQEGAIAWVESEDDSFSLSLDDALLRVVPMEGYLSIAITERTAGALESQRRRELFLK